MTRNKVFIGAGEASAIEARVLIHSLRKNSKANNFDIFVFNGTHDSLEDEFGKVIQRINMPLEVKYTNVTEFSNYRWYIPELCHFEGRAIWLDSDIICLTDIDELFSMDMGEFSILARENAYLERGDNCWGMSVCLIDCAKFKIDVDQAFQMIRENKIIYSDLAMFTTKFLNLLPVKIGKLSEKWNSFDYYDSSTKIIHYTDLWTQPWKYHNHPYGKLWFTYMREALSAGLLTSKMINLSIARAYVRKDIMGGNTRISAATYKFKEWLKGTGERILGKFESALASDQHLLLKPHMNFISRIKFYALNSFKQKSLGSNKVFFICSKAEERMFQSLLLQMTNENLKDVVLIDIYGATSSKLPSVKSYSSFKSFLLEEGPTSACVFFSCLDFKKYSVSHRLGISAVNLMNSFGVKTVCLQHGGKRSDNLSGMTTSCSSKLLVWDSATKKILKDELSSVQDIFIFGNPLWSESLGKLESKAKYFKTDKIKVLVATCLHTEYDSLQNSAAHYEKYVADLSDAFKNDNKFEIVVKPHPVDRERELNIYKKYFSHIEISGSVYDLLRDCDIVLSRASTVMEEGLMIGKKVIGFDPVKDGPLHLYSYLFNEEGFKATFSGEELRAEIKNLGDQKFTQEVQVPQDLEMKWAVFEEITNQCRN